MSLIIAGGIFGGILLYNNSDYFIMSGLKLYTLLQNKYDNYGLENINQSYIESISINNTNIFVYKINNKQLYSIQNNISENLVKEKSECMNPIMDITLKINDKVINCDIISKFILLDTIELNKDTLENLWIPILNYIENKNIDFNKQTDKIYWEILDNDFKTYSGENLKITLKDNNLNVEKKI